MIDWVDLAEKILLVVLGVVLKYAFDRLTARQQRKEESKKVQAERQQQQLEKFYDRMQIYLDAAGNGFRNQCYIRDRLVELLRRNHDLSPYSGYEYAPLFTALFPKMNEEERVQFRFIRGITENTQLKYNSLVVGLLDEYPQFYNDEPDMKLLHDHLNFWLDKYNGVFKTSEDMCLVYVGGEDKKPFPAGIENVIQHKIQTMRNSQT